LREKENLTEYDLKAAEARFQIALKQAALDDAQNNKTSMKLTRNEQGNWSYQYIADEDDVMNKRQELLDAYKEELKKVPIEDWYWERNVGDYKPCHNYKLVMKRPKKYNDGDFKIHMFGKYLPGIMFRDGDIYVTNSQYIGRHVNLRKTSVCDVDENLYNYCIKNLK
jgi:hypothetical protein